MAKVPFWIDFAKNFADIFPEKQRLVRLTSLFEHP